MSTEPILIAVAPNGARKTKSDHPKLPLSSAELIETAISCLDAGAAMMHFHVRGRDGQHTLDHAVYAPVLKELEAAVGEEMLFQVSSEAAGRYRSDQQIEQMRRLAPHCLSCGLREIFSDQNDYGAGHEFCSQLYSEGVLVQYILYSPAEVEWYGNLCKEGVIPGQDHLLLFVLGRYGPIISEREELPAYISALKGNNPWMVCGFGKEEHAIMAQATQLGGHCRVGFENNQQLPNNAEAPDNSALIKLTSEMARKAGRLPGSKFFAESLHDKGK